MAHRWHFHSCGSLVVRQPLYGAGRQSEGKGGLVCDMASWESEMWELSMLPWLHTSGKEAFCGVTGLVYCRQSYKIRNCCHDLLYLHPLCMSTKRSGPSVLCIPSTTTTDNRMMMCMSAGRCSMTLAASLSAREEKLAYAAAIAGSYLQDSHADVSTRAIDGFSATEAFGRVRPIVKIGVGRLRGCELVTGWGGETGLDWCRV